MSNHTAVIGQPIEHSISPKIHNFWIKENGIEVGEYKKISLNKEDVKSFLENFSHLLYLKISFYTHQLPFHFL